MCVEEELAKLSRVCGWITENYNLLIECGLG
jgi:hypothetical protein